MGRKTALLDIGELLEFGERPKPQGRLKEPQREQLVELIADIGRRIVLRTPAGQRRENVCLLCRHGPVPLRHERPCWHPTFFMIADGNTAGVDPGTLKKLITWLAPRLMRRDDNGAAATKFCLMCTMGLREFQTVRTLGPRQPCRHEEIWRIAGYTPRI